VDRPRAPRDVRPRPPTLSHRSHALTGRRQFKGTRVECYNCGGIFFKATGKGIADRLDKVEKFLAECEGDETRHPSYGSGMY
jgi:hypothetical protein